MIFKIPVLLCSSVLSSDDTTAKGNNSRTSSSKLHEIIVVLLQSKVKVRFMGKDVQLEESIDLTLASCDAKEPNDVHESLRPKVATANAEMPLRDLLSKGNGKEREAQDVVSGHLKLIEAVDNSLTSCGMFSFPRRVGRQDNLYPSTAKTDVLCATTPMAMELKSTTAGGDLGRQDFDGLTQGLERLVGIRGTNATLRIFIVFVVTGRSAWELTFSRNIGSFNRDTSSPFEEINCERLRHEDVWSRWFTHLYHTERNPIWFLTADGPRLLMFLNSVTAPYLCGSRLIGASGHRVYGISVPQAVQYQEVNGRKKKIVGISAKQYDFCVKVIPDAIEYKEESEAAVSICKEYIKLYECPFHIIGTYEIPESKDADLTEPGSHVEGEKEPSEEALEAVLEDITLTDIVRAEEPLHQSTPDSRTLELELLPTAERAVLQLVKKAADFVLSLNAGGPVTVKYKKATPDICTWRQFPDSCAPEGGLLIMRVGTQVDINKSNAESVLEGLHRSLVAMHNCRYLHCDIREPNIMLFPDGFQLIDFGVAQKIPANSDCVIFALQHGGQFKCRMQSLRSCQIGQRIAWKVEDDCYMASSCVIRALNK
jgi:hypothetical protein